MKRYPNLLAIETSGPHLSVAVRKGRELPSELGLEGFLEHAKNLLPMIHKGLSQKGLILQDIDAFLIGRGPGSFTGLKIGFATLKAFLACKKKPCYGVSSLDMIALQAPIEGKPRLGVLLDARRERLYARFYRRQKDRWVPSGPVKASTLPEVISKTPDSSYLAGDALRRYRDVFEKAKGLHSAEFLPEARWHPRASTLIRCFEQNRDHLSKQSSFLKKMEGPEDFVPLYLRHPVAVRKKRSRGKHR